GGGAGGAARPGKPPLATPAAPRHNAPSSPRESQVPAMPISQSLCALALKQLVGGACKVAGVEAGEGAVAAVVGVLTHQFFDHSQKLLEALREANEKAWRAAEVALAGEGLWDRCK